LVGSTTTFAFHIEGTVAPGEIAVSGIFLQSPGTSYFLDQGSCATLSCTVNVRFEPSSPGSFPNTLEAFFLYLVLQSGDTLAARASADLTGFAVPATVPLPAALPLFAGGLAIVGLLGWRRKRKTL